jgi:hypothetical protein
MRCTRIEGEEFGEREGGNKIIRLGRGVSVSREPVCVLNGIARTFVC